MAAGDEGVRFLQQSKAASKHQSIPESPIISALQLSVLQSEPDIANLLSAPLAEATRKPDFKVADALQQRRHL